MSLLSGDDFVIAVSGSAGGAFSSILTFPLDTVKTRLNKGEDEEGNKYNDEIDVIHRTFEKEGVGGFFCGCLAKTLHNAMQKFEFFYIYNWILRAVRNMLDTKTLGVRSNLAVGYVSAVTTVMFTNPLEVAANRMQTGASQGGLFDTLAEMYAEGGLGTFFKGYATNLLLCINPAIEFTFFDQLKNTLIQRMKNNGIKRPHLTTWQVFWIGALAKACATCVTYPGVTAKTLIQTAKKEAEDHLHANGSDKKENSYKSATSEDGVTHQPVHKSHSFTQRAAARASMDIALVRKEVREESAWQVCQDVIDREGVFGLYKGLKSQLIKAVIGSAIMMVCKERIDLVIRWLFRHYVLKKSAAAKK